MNELLNILHQIESCNDVNLTNQLIKKASKLANNLLVNQSNLNFKNIKILNENGFNVYPGNLVDFGGVQSCIETKKGSIVFNENYNLNLKS